MFAACIVRGDEHKDNIDMLVIIGLEIDGFIEYGELRQGFIAAFGYEGIAGVGYGDAAADAGAAEPLALGQEIENSTGFYTFLAIFDAPDEVFEQLLFAVGFKPHDNIIGR